MQSLISLKINLNYNYYSGSSGILLYKSIKKLKNIRCLHFKFSYLNNIEEKDRKQAHELINHIEDKEINLERNLF